MHRYLLAIEGEGMVYMVQGHMLLLILTPVEFLTWTFILTQALGLLLICCVLCAVDPLLHLDEEEPAIKKKVLVNDMYPPRAQKRYCFCSTRHLKQYRSTSRLRLLLFNAQLHQ